MNYHDVALRIAGAGEEFSIHMDRVEKIKKLLASTCSELCNAAGVPDDEEHKLNALQHIYYNMKWPDGNKPDDYIEGENLEHSIEGFIHEMLHAAGESTYVLDPGSKDVHFVDDDGFVSNLNRIQSKKSDIENDLWEVITRKHQTSGRGNPRFFNYSIDDADKPYGFPLEKYPEGVNDKSLLNTDPSLNDFVHNFMSYLWRRSAEIGSSGLKNLYLDSLGRIYRNGKLMVGDLSFQGGGPLVILRSITDRLEVLLKTYDPRKYTIIDEDHYQKYLFRAQLAIQDYKNNIRRMDDEELENIFE
jgi:hypothetical protein